MMHNNIVVGRCSFQRSIQYRTVQYVLISRINASYVCSPAAATSMRPPSLTYAYSLTLQYSTLAGFPLSQRRDVVVSYMVLYRNGERTTVFDLSRVVRRYQATAAHPQQ